MCQRRWVDKQLLSTNIYDQIICLRLANTYSTFVASNTVIWTTQNNPDSKVVIIYVATWDFIFGNLFQPFCGSSRDC